MRSLEFGSSEPDEVIPQEGGMQEEVGNLETEFDKKTLHEKFVAEIQTKKPAKEAQENRKKAGGSERGENTRFERGQILKAYKILRKEIKNAEEMGEDAVDKKELLKEIRDRAKEMEHGLDELEHQFEDNVSVIDVDTKYGEFSVPVTELDLKKPKEGEKDERVPYIFWGGINSNVQTNGCVVMALALAGQRVIAVPHFEQKQVVKPEGVTAKNIFKEERGFDTHAEVNIGIIEAYGLEKCNLIGYSTGANVALETGIKMSNDQEQQGKVNDLIAIEPVGFDKAGLGGLVAGLGKNILQDMPFSEVRLKVLQQAAETNATEQKWPLEPEAVLTLGEKHFSQERLNQINVSGKVQMWGGRSSGLAKMDLMRKVVGGMQEATLERDKDAQVPELIEVVGGTHYTPITNAMGFVREITSEKEEGEQSREPKVMNRKDLANSAMKQILQDIQK